jgi:hypothetical protein
MKLLMLLLFIRFPEYRQMLGLLQANLHEWREIVRLDSSCDCYLPGTFLFKWGLKIPDFSLARSD